MNTAAKRTIVLVVIALFAFFLRTFNVNWDGGYHLHPDERFISMFVTQSDLPSSITAYLSHFSTTSWNPYSYPTFSFFVYGLFPMTITKLVAGFAGLGDFTNMTLVGRVLSALYDVGSLMFVFLTMKFFKEKFGLRENIDLLAAALYAIAVLPIQQSHFFTTDPMLVFLSMGTFYAALRYSYFPKYSWLVMSAVMFGFALGTKVSALYILPLIGIYMLITVNIHDIVRDGLRFMLHGIIFVIIAYLAVRIADPHMFVDGILQPLLSESFVNNIQELKSYSTSLNFPPAIQWIDKEKLWFPLKNMAVFGVGIVYFITSMIGAVVLLKKRDLRIYVLMLWIVGIFMYLGTQIALTMRYFYILYPFLAISAAAALFADFQDNLYKARTLILACVGLGILFWPFMFMRIYTQQHPYLQASEWIYKNIPQGSTIVLEEWNDPLPLNLPPDESGSPRLASVYKSVSVNMFAPESTAKHTQIENALRVADFYIFPNNRTYGAIIPLEYDFPVTSQVLKDILDGSNSYVPIAKFTRNPSIKIGSFEYTFNDEWAEEAFTVYDHPTVIILQNISHETR